MRLIDADALLEKKQERDCCFTVTEWDILNTPTIDPVKHGRWKQDKAAEIQYRYNCSECGNPIYDKIRPYKYCPNCGARMDGEQK